ncbi:PhoH family protein [Pontibacter sp. JAM-7]|uniref:PhoH family protein n=1 Tax=Pontibacter sp. JAM-7 TaxID=3366581 RepID=UPI003AF5A169
MSHLHSTQLTLTPDDSRCLALLCGPFNEYLKLIEQRLGIEIRNHGHDFQLLGEQPRVAAGKTLLVQLYQQLQQGDSIGPEQIHLQLQQTGIEAPVATETEHGSVVIHTKKTLIRPRGENQTGYVRSIRTQDINFGIGPAGTGKTYLAVACAVDALEREEVARILLVRPAVEAGEKLGFLPGDLSQKVDPYLRPLYDALYEMLGFERVGKLIERNIIEVAPLAYMRGRTLNNAFVILDESQNTTREQMKMFLTRIGFGSTAVITGDVTQIDLPKGTRSGLLHASEVLKGVEGIGFTRFTANDVVRHPLVQHIVRAYDRFEKQEQSSS